MKKRINYLVLSLLLLFPLVSILFPGCSQKSDKQLVIFHAGSLALPMKALADSFTLMHPGTEFLMEAAGSVDCARKITELGRSCDIMASADYTVIDQLLIPEYASVNQPFAVNSIVIAYTDKSRKSEEITSENWYRILLSPDVFYGRSDPHADPCGYRTIFTLQLAERYYAGADGKAPFQLRDFTEKDNRFIRPKEVDLLALLGSQAIDYMFIYKSIALQHGLRFIALPPEINLGDSTMAEFYATAQLKIRGSKPGDSVLVKGTPITYSFTIPHNAENPELAKKFAGFLTDPDGGQRILRWNLSAPKFSRNL
ncbi:MAG: extracellular solute-binding protein [Bacteroidales bacterium]|nr:extracellular solute-binding protein [Bacteroidales bacterium]MDD3522340.1 extracellular solute-binding protein [Bacteroidales bacterium]MDD4030138.1 extracellular solute-binding protein [Bacteroidales bacterium]MDD4435523.1 extracellular solute-binding protein [Bacteroidales bacterium]MDD5732690.1 extracellular solute-binding protein [Bacteroidales bacterium]